MAIPPKSEFVTVWSQLYVDRFELEWLYRIPSKLHTIASDPGKICGVRGAMKLLHATRRFFHGSGLFGGQVAGLFDERRDIRVQGLQVRFMGVNHVARRVKMHLDITSQLTLDG